MKIHIRVNSALYIVELKLKGLFTIYKYSRIDQNILAQLQK